MEFTNNSNTANTADVQEDRGIERVPFEYRNYCWQQTLETAAKNSDSTKDQACWEVFKKLICQISYGGVSSLAEAKRLYKAEQIGHGLFFATSAFQGQTKQNLATTLAEEIENTFQNLSRPATLERQEEKIIVDLINYYFPSPEALQNFELALAGEFDKQNLTEKHSEEVQFTDDHSVNSFIEETQTITNSQSPENSNQADKGKNLFSSKIFNLTQSSLQAGQNAQPTSEYHLERPKLKSYLENRDSGKSLPNVPHQIQAIIDEFYPPAG